MWVGRLRNAETRFHFVVHLCSVVIVVFVHGLRSHKFFLVVSTVYCFFERSTNRQTDRRKREITLGLHYYWKLRALTHGVNVESVFLDILRVLCAKIGVIVTLIVG